MKKSKMLRRLAAVLLAGTMIMAMGTSAFAEEPDNNTVNVSFTKTLDMSKAEGASVPNVTFSYGIKAGERVEAAETTPEILAGVGTPTIGTVEYGPSDGEKKDEEGKVIKTVNVDFSGVTFERPGIYRYVITENTTDNADITNDINTTRYLDVYVVNGENDGYEIADFQLLSEAVQPNSGTGVYDGNAKSDGYTNTYTTYELSLDKVVTGTMGDKGKEFEFTIDFEGPANSTFTYNEASVKLGEDGKGSVTGIKLADTTNPAVIKGIPSNVEYTITEKINANEGYTTSYTVNGENETKGTTISVQTMGKINNAVVCTNVKNAVTPTGIVMNIAPYVLMVVVAAVLAIVFLRKRNTFEN